MNVQDLHRQLHTVIRSKLSLDSGCRLPGDVGSPADFWDLMMKKGTGNTPKVPPSRFNIDAHIHPNNDRPGSFGVLGGYFLNEDLRGFDPALFNITPIEAMWMDPQQRKILEVVYEALESGGISIGTYIRVLPYPSRAFEWIAASRFAPQPWLNVFDFTLSSGQHFEE